MVKSIVLWPFVCTLVLGQILQATDINYVSSNSRRLTKRFLQNKSCCKCRLWKHEKYSSNVVSKCQAESCSKTCDEHLDCRGSGECCVFPGYDHQKDCRECYHTSDCSSGKYCCNGFSDRVTICRENCIGLFCDERSRCGGANDCCRSNVCVNCSTITCKHNHECPVGKYCCKNIITGEAKCQPTCEGQPCRTKYDCPARGQCCIENKCKSFGCSCDSNSDCKFGHYCCKGPTKSICNSSCIGLPCSSDSDCALWTEVCTHPDKDCGYSFGRKCPDNVEKLCFKWSGCSSNENCNIFGTGYKCCRNSVSDTPKNCYSSCIDKSCYRDVDCGGANEYCNDDNKCKMQSSAGWIIGKWIGIAVATVFVVAVASGCAYLRLKRKKRNSQSSQENGDQRVQAEEQITHSRNDHRYSEPVQTWQVATPSAPSFEAMQVMPTQPSEITGRLSGNISEQYRSLPSNVPSCPPPSYETLFGRN